MLTILLLLVIFAVPIASLVKEYNFPQYGQRPLCDMCHHIEKSIEKFNEQSQSGIIWHVLCSSVQIDRQLNCEDNSAKVYKERLMPIIEKAISMCKKYGCEDASHRDNTVCDVLTQLSQNLHNVQNAFKEICPIIIKQDGGVQKCKEYVQKYGTKFELGMQALLARLMQEFDCDEMPNITCEECRQGLKTVQFLLTNEQMQITALKTINQFICMKLPTHAGAACKTAVDTLFARSLTNFSKRLTDLCSENRMCNENTKEEL